MSQPQALYRFFAADGSLLYVGISLNPGARWKQHCAGKPWWTEVANIAVEHHANREAVMDAERQAIKNELPRYNVVYNQTPAAGERTAAMLRRMAEPPERYWDACPTCGNRTLPVELYVGESGWIAVHECCESPWRREVEAA